MASMSDGPLFRGVDRHGNVAESALTDQYAARRWRPDQFSAAMPKLKKKGEPLQ
jgi:hypothetical protein